MTLHDRMRIVMGTLALVFLIFWAIMVFGFGWPIFGPWPW